MAGQAIARRTRVVLASVGRLQNEGYLRESRRRRRDGLELTRTLCAGAVAWPTGRGTRRKIDDDAIAETIGYGPDS